MTEDELDDLESKYFGSQEFRDGLIKKINDDTWGKGRPKYYMDQEGWLVEHWKDGTINKIKELKTRS